MIDAVLSIPIVVVVAILLLSIVVGVGVWLEFARPVDDTAEFTALMDDLRKTRTP